MSIHKQIIKKLIEIEAIQIKTDRSFIWTSGIHSPIYCDNRLTLSYPDIREMIINGFLERLVVDTNEIDCIAGCATAGIPHAAWLADRLNLPMAYVRAKPKGHGKKNQIEGLIKSGDRVLVVEDLVSTGNSVFEAIDAIEKSDAQVIGVQSIFSYGLRDAKNGFKDRKIPYHSLADFDQLVSYLVDSDSIETAEAESLIDWRNEL